MNLGKITFGLCLLVLSSVFLAEQRANDHQAINRMAKDLGLNDDQKAKVESIFDEEKQTVEAIFKEEGEKLQAAQQQTHNSLQQVLTPEQLAKLDQKMQRKSKRAGKKR